MSKRTRHVIVWSVVAVMVAAAAAIVLAGVPRWTKVRLPERPGVADAAGAYDPDLWAPAVLKITDARLLTPVDLSNGTSVQLLASVYETPPLRGVPGTRSDVFAAPDQIGYGRALVAMDKRRAFMAWVDDFDAAYRDASTGWHCVSLQMTEAGSLQRGPARWSVTLAYARALLEGYDAFGGRTLKAAVTAVSDRLLPVFQARETAEPLTVGSRMLLGFDAWDRPPRDLVPEPGEDVPVEHGVGTYLADIDLWALYALSRFDPAWAPIATAWETTLRQAWTDGDVPYYASAVADDGTYYAVTGEGHAIKMREQLTIALHVAETGHAEPHFIAMLRTALRDRMALPRSIHVVSGAPSSEAEAVDYALARLLGRATGDDVLTRVAYDAMARSRASSQTSDIFGGWYRPGATVRTYRLVAADQTAVLRALR